jgi:tetratricopeptide (TPR) repeat protein/tRNA A-37 threonylcarbamoyl transferase component Bud32
MSGTDYSEDEAKADRLLRFLQEHESLRTVPDALPPAATRSAAWSAPPRYELRERLGEGATAVVHRAFDRELQREVALKVSRDAVGMTTVARERFRREARTAAGLAHPNIVTVHDAGEADGRFYLVMEVVEGRPFNAVLKDRALDQKTLVAMLEQASRGVAVAHAAGIVHRDLKPANILIPKNGEPKVGDFGLAHLADSTQELTRSGTPLGTPVYMAPEQVEGRSAEISPRTDVYALGAILYEILTGAPPHAGESLAAIYRKILNDEPTPPRKGRPQLSHDLETITLKALEKSPARRYGSASEFADDLRRYLGGELIAGRPPGALYRLLRSLRKRALAVGLAGTVAVAGSVIAAIWWSGVVRSGRLEEETHREQARYAKERSEAISAMREMARTSLSAALNLRRRGASIPELRPFEVTMKDAYARAKARAPQSAEVEYLMGRMRRIAIEHETAIEHQNRALAIDPEFAPALYERVVLKSRANSQLHWNAVYALRPQGSSQLPPDWLERADATNPRFAQIRREILDDMNVLERILARGYSEQGLLAISRAHVANGRGILAFWSAEYSKARELLRQAVTEDPLLDEAWELLGWLLYEFAGETQENGERERRLEEARRCFDDAIEKDRGYPRIWMMRSWVETRLAELYQRMGRDPFPSFADADRDIAQSALLFPGQSSTWRQRAVNWRKRGLSRRDRGEDPRQDFEEAERWLEEALRLNAAGADNYSLRGALRADQGRVKEQDGDRGGAEECYKAAIADYEKAGSLDPAIGKAVVQPLEETRARLRALHP